MSVSTNTGMSLSRQQRSQMPSLLEFHSPTAVIIAETPRGMARFVVWTIVGLVVGLGAAMVLIPIDKVVTATGRVVATNASTVIQPLETAIVREIMVHEGDLVHKGDLLARLDPTFSYSDKVSNTLQVENYRAEVERLKAESAGVPYKPTVLNAASLAQQVMYAQRREEWLLKRENYRQKIGSLQQLLLKAAGDMQGYHDRARFAAEVEDKRRDLEKLGWGSQLNRLTAQDQLAEMRRNYEFAQNTAAGAAKDLAAMKAEDEADQRDWQSQVSQSLSDTNHKLIDAEAALEKSNLRSQLVELRAAEDSVVHTIAPVSVGSVMQSGDKFMTLIPVNAPLELETALQGDDAGYVHLGDPVTIKFNTFPYVKYGGAAGIVRSVSPDSFTTSADERTKAGVLNQPGSEASGTAYYRLNVAIQSIDLHDVPKGFHVTAGMPVTADVLVGKRTVFNYIMSRTLPVFMDGMREP